MEMLLSAPYWVALLVVYATTGIILMVSWSRRRRIAFERDVKVAAWTEILRRSPEMPDAVGVAIAEAQLDAAAQIKRAQSLTRSALVIVNPIVALLTVVVWALLN